MDFLWPNSLLLLGSLPLVLAIYIWMLRRRSRFAVRYPSLFLIKESVPVSLRLKRHFPFFLFLAALASLLVALGRPVVPQALLSGQTTIILAFDTSRSMCMKDVLPTRLDVAKAAALSFIDQPVTGTQMGIVAFSGFAELAQAPTTDIDRLESTITNLTTATRTAIGSAILRSLDAIAKVDHRITASEAIDDQSPVQAGQLSEQKLLKKDYAPHIIVLLTDGANNTGPSPILAAQQAADRGVRIYAIGFGTTGNAIADCWNMVGDIPPTGPGSSAQGTGGSGSGPDEATLKQVAEITGGEFYSATNAEELVSVFQTLHHYVAMTNKTIEISALFTGLAALLGTLALLLNFWWHPFF